MEKPITSFRDLEVYQNAFTSCVIVHQKVLPQLPASEKFDLRDQLSRSTKAVPRLIAEGYAKRHQRLGFQKYLDDAMGECNETIVGIEQVKSLYGVAPELCDRLIDIYDKTARQLYNLAKAWRNFKTKDVAA